MLKIFIGVVEKKVVKTSTLFKVLDKAQYLMYVGIVIHMLLKLVNTMKKTFGTDKHCFDAKSSWTWGESKSSCSSGKLSSL